MLSSEVKMMLSCVGMRNSHPVVPGAELAVMILSQSDNSAVLLLNLTGLAAGLGPPLLSWHALHEKRLCPHRNDLGGCKRGEERGLEAS